jgi:septal ring factor EnvC (AmiA/AmiB activator)
MASPRRLALALAITLGAAASSRAQPLAPTARVADDVDTLAGQSRAVSDELAALTARQEALRARARTQARWLYHLVQGDALAARGGPAGLLEHAAHAQRVRRVLENTVKTLDADRRRAASLREERTRLEALLSAARARRVEADTARSLARAAAAEGATGAPSVTVYGGAPSATEVDTFAASAGRLTFPIAGRAEVRRAWREGADGPGVEVRAPLGTAVRASFAGRVAFADRYGAYGQIVIVDHGAHYYTVSANLGRVDVRVGQELAQGEVLGSVGDEGPGPMLYFEVRQGSQTIDPVPWLGL